MGLFISLYLLVIFIFSGLGLHLGNRISYYLILILPFVLYFHSFTNKEKIGFPKKLTVLWFFFTFFELISTILSYDHELSIERLLLYIVGFFILVYFYNKKDYLKPYIRKTIISAALIFTAAFLFKDVLMKYVQIFDVNQLFNFYFPLVRGNNHLGIWLGMTILILLSEKRLILLTIFAPFFIFAYSRSAYLGVFVAITILLVNKFRGFIFKENKIILYCLFILVSIIFILGIAIFVPRNDFLSDRPEYYKIAIKGFNDKPLFGNGPGNYVYLSRKYAAISNGVFGTSSHNIFLDILSGSGLFAFVFFCLILVQIIKNNHRNHDYAVFVFLLTVAMASYIYVMPTYMLLFFIYAGLSFKDETCVRSGVLHNAIITTIFLIAIYMAFSEALFIRENYIKSLSLYPFRKDAYEAMIMQISPLEKSAKYVGLIKYKKHFPYNFEQLNFSANIYSRMGDYKKALTDYLEIYRNKSGFSSKIVKEIMWLYITLGEPTKGYYFAKNFIRTVFNDKYNYEHIINDTYDLCIYVNKHYLDKGACF